MNGDPILTCAPSHLIDLHSSLRSLIGKAVDQAGRCG